MQASEFERVKDNFAQSDIDGKVSIYVNADGLTKEQYCELLKMYPPNEIKRLEAALK